LGDDPRPYVIEVINGSRKEATYTFYNLPQGDYALVAGHDENKDHMVLFDPATRLPLEGVYVVNLDRLQLSESIGSINLDALNSRSLEASRASQGRCCTRHSVGSRHTKERVELARYPCAAAAISPTWQPDLPAQHAGTIRAGGDQFQRPPG